jgi:DNA repair exonuclease SbcCD ATPase subunit
MSASIRFGVFKKIESIIGTYDNFMRIVMTTSDTLNRILSNDMAVFIDSLLYDSGLDIFDKKLEGLKVYQKRINENPRVNCNIEMTNVLNATLKQEITALEGEINEIDTVKLPDIQKRIQNGRTYLETITKKLFKIDSEIYNLDVDVAREDISANKKNIVEIKARKMILIQSIASLSESYDEAKLKELIEKKDAHKTNEYNLKLKIKDFERKIADLDHEIEIINGKIFNLKRDGGAYKQNIADLKNSKTCPTCGQQLTADHQTHIDTQVKAAEKEMFRIAGEIKQHQVVIESTLKIAIKTNNDEIDVLKNDIIAKGLEMENILKEIGTLTNEKNDVEKRKELQGELDSIPTKIQNEELKIGILEQKITSHENSLLQIEENQRIEKGIAATKLKIAELEVEESDEKENIYIRKTSIGEKQIRIKNNELLIAEYKIQEYRDAVMNLYKKCVHRDGIPRQMLSNYIIPKINLTLENILSVAPFKVWLDVDDLRPKLVYNNRPTSIIDCIGASGKERTFSSVVLKFALNQINVKAKPTIFLLDEVMGKLDENSVEEFIEILQLIKQNMKKVLVIEHTHEINPDYLINVHLDDEGISSLILD